MTFLSDPLELGDGVEIAVIVETPFHFEGCELPPELWLSIETCHHSTRIMLTGQQAASVAEVLRDAAVRLDRAAS